MANQKTYTVWEDVPTLQSKEMISELVDAKEHQRAKLLISDTGLGKTKSIEIFKNKLPNHTYVVVVGDSFKLIHVVDEILRKIGVMRYDVRDTIYEKLNAIREKLDDIKRERKAKPIIILDEAENLKPQVLKMIKELYDAIHDYCAIVLIGTEQILDSILNRKHKNRQSVPQLWRRFKAGTKYISALNKARDFKPFFDMYIPEAPDLQDLLNEQCENYGELHDYLHPVLVYCTEQKKAITEDLFRLFHKLPKQQVTAKKMKAA